MVLGKKERYVEVGRVAFIAHGDEKGKLCVIVDIIDQNRALVDGPCSNVNRQPMNFKTLHLTKFKINIQRSSRHRVVRKAWEREGITDKWNNSTWAKKIVLKEKRAQLTDFERFKLMRAKQARNRIINTELSKLKKKAKKAASTKKPGQVVKKIVKGKPAKSKPEKTVKKTEKKAAKK